MSEIDKLEGKALAQAVAVKIGLTQDVNHPLWWDDENGRGWCISGDEDIYQGHQLVSYRPDHDIAQAWELDEEGWSWQFSNDDDEVATCVCTTTGYYTSYVRVANHHTKLAAYATARCRAFLKAKAAMRSDDITAEQHNEDS